MHTDQALIKRVIAVAGDTVQVKGGQLYINGVQQEENYVFEEPGMTYKDILLRSSM
jgi:signal peptidase I